MNVTTIPSRAVDRSLRILRLPVDTAIGLLDRDGRKTSAFTITIDRADVAVRRFAGRVLHNDDLQRDAQARDSATEERAKALELRTEAELHKRRADAAFEQDLENVREERTEAEQSAANARAAVKEKARSERERLAEQTTQRKSTVRNAAQRTEARIDERAQKARLEELEKESEVLESRKAAVTTRSEAQRLQRAASEVKNKRKSG